MKDIYQTFEFNLIKERLKKYANCELARYYVDNLSIIEDQEELQDNLVLLSESLAYNYKYSRLVIYNHPNLLPSLINIHKGGIGNISFFASISYLLENIKLLKAEFKEKDSYPHLDELISSLDPLTSLKAKIDRVISPEQEILSTASSKLMQIRSKKERLENGISSLMSSLIEKYRLYLSDYRPSLKNGVYTLMVKSTFKNRINGIVLASSDSGNTFFIEPQELLEVYNNLSTLREEERIEIENILKDLSSDAKSNLDALRKDNSLVSLLDFNFAKASYAISYHGNVANISSERKIRLMNAAHPLIDLSKVVRNDFVMDKERMMIITGPNAGGKTVALKLLGLLVIMHQSGLALPCEDDAYLPYFDHIYGDIGDNQSLIDNLSTFSSHMVNLRDILEHADDTSLVIIDELGSGTSPLDGEALALGAIDYLLKVNCFSFISSHYEGVKNYALENNQILCASMVFDEDNLSPTYKLLLHAASSSFGVEVASRLGLPNEVICRAKEYIKEKKSTSEELMLEDLNAKIRENELIKAQLKEQANKLKEQEKVLTQEIEKNKHLHQQILDQAEEEKQKIVAKAQDEIDDIFNEFKKMNDVKLHQVISAKKKISDKLATDEEDEDVADGEVNIGDDVELIDSKVRGKVISLKRDKATILTEMGMNVEINKNKVRKVLKPKKPKNVVKTYDYVAHMKQVSTECNVIGLTVREALPIVSKYLDDAVSVHYHEVRIIHGAGTGKLRQGIHEYLKKSPYVASFRLGGMGEGGVGATVVTLK